MEDVSLERDVSLVTQCVEELIDFLGQAYVSVRASSAVSEQVCEDLGEAIRFLQQLSIFEVSSHDIILFSINCVVHHHRVRMN